MNKKKAFSFIKGYTFLFQEGENQIEAWFSNFTGLEKVYVNGVLITSQRNLSTNSTNTFKIGDNEYTTNLHVVSLLKGPFTCTLSKNGNPYKRQKLLFPMVNQKNYKFSFLGRFILFISIGAVFGVAKSYWQLPKETTYIFLAVLFVMVFFSSLKANKGKEPVIEDEDVV